jgi:hypothetical protein
MEAIRISETSVLTRATLCHPEDGISRRNSRSYFERYDSDDGTSYPYDVPLLAAGLEN